MKAVEEKSVLRWGGLAGILAGIFFFLTIVIAATTLLLDAGAEGPVIRFPDVRAALTVVEGLYLVGLILYVTLFLALYQALRGTSLAPALGSVVGVMGLTMFAVGSLVYVALAHVSGLYYAPGATSEEQATLVLIWESIQGVFSSTDSVGLLLVPIGVIVLGKAMHEVPAFGKRFGRVTVVLGAVGVIGMTLLVVDPLSPTALVGIFVGAFVAIVIFPLLLGWKVYSLSRAP
ncbi:MAG TPA: hypothetical protein VFL17_14320 [Anaerolineae bacterium]|nr:hypothetical protein [Anaerolineae bacterium]